MASPVINSISLCSGVGMLDEGVRAAFDYLGVTHRTVAYAEWEAPAASQLIALMEAGAMDAAPVWCGDLRLIEATQFRGVVDCVIAGFPCQDLSVAGKRAGLDGKRSGLFFNVADIADDCGARFLILENVSGIASASASVVDETEGELDERAASRVLGELADRGWDAEWMHLRASDVGATHQRERWFCLAWRNVAYADNDGSQGRRVPASGGRDESGDSQWASAAMGDAARDGWRERRSELQGWTRRSDSPRSGMPTYDFFAPGPLDDRWAGIVADRPDLAPAVGGRLNSNFTEWLMGWPIGWCDPKEPVNHAEAENWRAAILRALQNIVGEEAHQREVGGFRCIQSPKILQQELYGGVHVERRSETAGVCDSSSQAIVEEELRTLRIYEPPVDPSQRPKLEEQCAEQFANPMQFVSHIIASLRGRNVSASAKEAAMQVLREAELQVRGLQHMSDENKATWESLLWEERVDCLVEAAITAHQKPSRNHQLRQAGNGVVAFQASVAIVTLARRAGIF